MSDFKKVRRGQRLQIPAGDWNGAMDAAKAYRSGQMQHIDPTKDGPFERTLVRIQNTTETTYGRGQLMSLSPRVLISDEQIDQGRCLEATAVADPPSDEAGAPVILLQPLAPDEIGKGFIAGVGFARINLQDVTHQFVGWPASSGQVLTSTPHRNLGRILWAEGSTGVRNALILLHDSEEFPRRIVVIASDETWTVPPESGGRLLITAIGGGGGGGGGGAQQTREFAVVGGDGGTVTVDYRGAGGGGGGSAQAVRALVHAAIGADLAVVIGKGGTGGSAAANGSAGTDTTINGPAGGQIVIEARGGAAGQAGSNTYGGEGGGALATTTTPSGSWLKGYERLAAQAGQHGLPLGGAGGLGGAGIAGYHTSSGGLAAHQGQGGNGGRGWRDGGDPNTAGTDGADGVVIICY